MAPQILATGAGAAEGLDKLLSRYLLEQRQAEVERANRAEEGIKNRGLDQNDWLKSSLAEEHQTNIETKNAAAQKEAERQTTEDVMLKDPEFAKTPQGQWLKLRRVAPNAPVQLFEPNMGKAPGPVEDTPEGLSRVGPDNKSVPITDALGNRTKKYHAPPSPMLVHTTNAAGQPEDRIVPKTVGSTFEPAPTNSTRTMMEGAKMLTPHITHVSSEAEALDKAGLFGPIMGRVRELATKYGTVQGLGSDDLDTQQRAMQQLGDAIAADPSLANDELTGEFAADLGLLMTGAARVHGGSRGGGSPMMLEHFKHILGATGTLQMFKGRMRSLAKFMGGYAGGPSAKVAGETAAPTDMYNEYLARTGGAKKP